MGSKLEVSLWPSAGLEITLPTSYLHCISFHFITKFWFESFPLVECGPWDHAFNSLSLVIKGTRTGTEFVSQWVQGRKFPSGRVRALRSRLQLLIPIALAPLHNQVLSRKFPSGRVRALRSRFQLFIPSHAKELGTGTWPWDSGTTHVFACIQSRNALQTSNDERKNLWTPTSQLSDIRM